MIGVEARMKKNVRSVRRLFTPVILVAAWQIAASTGYVNPNFVGSPAGVASSFHDLFVSGELSRHLGVSLWRALFGLLVGSSAGLVFGVVVGLSQRGEDLLDSTFQAVRTLPLLGLIPLFILWFGLGETPRILLIALGSFFPIYINVFKGIRGVDVRLIELASSYGLNPLQLMRDVILPSALPSALVGLRYAIGIAWLCLVVAEQVNATAGLGWVIIQANQLGQTSVVITALVIYAIVGVVADLVVRAIERRVLSWQQVFEGA
jgi:sulfonate transport system permease protein